MLIAGYLSSEGLRLDKAWAVVATVMAVFLMVLGSNVKGRVGGVLITERNLMSLARFQLTAWTLVLCSGYVTIAIARVFAGVPDPLMVQFPTEVWQLLGLSATSTVGASLVIKNKMSKDPADESALTKRVAAQTGDSVQDVIDNRQGIAYANVSPKDAHFSDIFEGDELANTAYIDLGKVQMFFFTLVAVVAYVADLYNVMRISTPAQIASLPTVSSGLLAVLGISHAAYLGSKAVDKTKTQ
jgi:hypothetical protein